MNSLTIRKISRFIWKYRRLMWVLTLLLAISYIYLNWYLTKTYCGGTISSYTKGLAYKIIVDSEGQLYYPDIYWWSGITFEKNLTLINVTVENTNYGPCRVSLENIHLPYDLPQGKTVWFKSLGCMPETYHLGDPYNMSIAITLRDGNKSIDTYRGSVRRTECGLMQEKTPIRLIQYMIGGYLLY
jgi:hypothetical protein